MGRMNGKVAIVTGGGQGVGLGIARAFAAEGAHIALTGRTESKLADAAGGLAALGAEVLTVTGDVRRREHAQQAVAQAAKRFGRVDVLVNNAQTSSVMVPIEELSDEEFAANLESGLWGSFHFMQYVLPLMKRQGGGKVINLASRRGIQRMAGAAAYACTKEAIRALTAVAAREWGKYNIQVNCISPAANSPATEKLRVERPEMMQKILAEMALGRLGDPERDIGRIAIFLATEMSDFLTGQTLNVDGGIVMS